MTPGTELTAPPPSPQEGDPLPAPVSDQSTPDSPPATDTSGVVRSFVHGLTWTGIMKLLGQTAAWSSTLVVARILTPADYGIVGMATIFLGLLQAVSEFGIGAAVVARRDLSDPLLPELNSASVMLGVVGAAVGALSAPLVGRFYDNPALPAVLAAMSVTFLITSFRSVPWALLQRDLRFKRLAVYDALQAIVLAGASVTFAVMGFRYWTLVLAAIASALISTLIAVGMHPVPFAIPHWHRLRRVLAFSGNVVAQRIAWYGYSNADFVIAGRFLGTSAMGAYTLAYELAHTPANKVGGMLFQLSPATLAALRHDPDRMRGFVVRVSEALMLLVAPLCVGLAAVAPVFVPLVLGQQWTEMIVPLQVLGLYAAVTILLVIPNQTLLVTGQEAFGTRYSIAQLVVMPVAFLVGSRWGTAGIALAWPIVHPFLAIILLRKVFRTIELPPRVFFREAVWPALSACAVMWLAVALARRALIPGEGDLAGLALIIAIGGITYLLVLFLAHRSRLKQAIQAVRSLRSRA